MSKFGNVLKFDSNIGDVLMEWYRDYFMVGKLGVKDGGIKISS